MIAFVDARATYESQSPSDNPNSKPNKPKTLAIPSAQTIDSIHGMDCCTFKSEDFASVRSFTLICSLIFGCMNREVLQLRTTKSETKLFYSCRTRAFAKGNETSKVLPTPSSLLTSTVAEIQWQRCFTIAKPRPVPPMSCERAFSTR